MAHLTQLTWHGPGPWKRIVASKAFYKHDFPAPHIDAVESVIDYRKKPTPYMQGLRFAPGNRSGADPDRRVLSEADLRRAAEEGKARGR